MLYLLYGDTFGIENEVKKILETNKFEDINISKYDLDAYNYKDVLEDASSVSLFDDKKIIIVSNASIFTSAKTSIELEPFEKYIENYNPNTILIFTADSKIDERKKVTKLIKKHGTVKDFVIDDDPSTFIKNLLGDYKIDNNTLNYLISLIGNDNYNIQNEIEKLKLYKEDKLITKEDIDNITTKNIDDDLFKLMNYILENNKVLAIESYHNMLLYSVEPIQILVSLANRYRLMYQVKTLYKLGYTDGDIAKELKQSPGYIYHLKKDSSNYSDKYLLNQIKALADLDYKIKSGKIEDKLGLELYILKK